MNNSKLIAVYQTLSGVEKRVFSKFLTSPYFNQREDVLQFWNYLLKESKYLEGGLSKKRIFEAVFPHTDFDETILRHTASQLLNCLEEFLAVRRFRKDSFQSKLYLAEAYRERNLEKHFNQSIRLAQKELESKVRDPKYYQDLFQLEFEKYAFIESQKRTTTNNLQEISHAFDVHALSGKLRQSCFLLAHQTVYKTEYDHSFLSFILEYLKDNPLLEIPAIAIYYHCYRALTEDDEQQFQQLKSYFESHGKHFSPEESGSILMLALNFCIRKINLGERAFIAEAFAFYQLGVENEILLEHGILSRFTYKNIVALGLNLKKFDWVENFIHTFRKKLETTYQNSYFYYNLARFHFTKKEYGNAMELLSKSDDSDLLLNLDGKVMLLKMYYELEELEALESLLGSMKTFLNRKKIIGYHKTHYEGIIRFTKKLMSLRPNDKLTKSKLEQEIENAEGLSEKEWLLGQLS